jgi:hypothetical protein
VERDDLARGGVYRCESHTQLFVQGCDLSEPCITC